MVDISFPFNIRAVTEEQRREKQKKVDEAMRKWDVLVKESNKYALTDQQFKNLPEVKAALDEESSIHMNLEAYIEVPYSFRDPFTHKVMVDPVQTVDTRGYFDKKSLEQRLRMEGDVIDPTNHQVIDKERNKNLPVDIKFKGIIEEWKRHHSSVLID